MYSSLLRKNKIVLTFSLIIFTVIFFRCINGLTPTASDVRGESYAGSLSCLRCHTEIHNTYQHTTHYRTTQPVNNLLRKSLSKGHFVFNDSMEIAIEKRDTGVYQVAYVNKKETLAKPLELAFGSGRHAFSFGYWQDKKLYQLPLSYFASIQGWANSPGFPADQAFFNRPIISRCFECHSSYIAEDAAQTEGLTAIRNLDKQSVIYGIDCERCHGAAANHVNFHTQNPEVKEARYMVSWKSLSRQQKLDVCAVCHSGNDLATQRSTFSFQPGDTLSNYYLPAFGTASSKSDVHGKQVQLLAASRCFQVSKTLECGSCHAAHEDGPRNLVISAAPCINCHQKGGHINCSIAASLGNAIVNNCIDCHMPNEESKKINFQMTAKGDVHAYLLRTHRIAIYPEVAQKIIAKLKSLEK